MCDDMSVSFWVCDLLRLPHMIWSAGWKNNLHHFGATDRNIVSINKNLKGWKKVMKHMRKALSLLLVLAMVVCFAVPAMAASPEGATVTVYITTDMFTKGGIDDNGNQVLQAYKGGVPTDYVKMVEVKPSEITATELVQYRNSYSNPDITSTTVNVLDAIACALTKSNLTYTGGWDDWNDPEGGYINSVQGFVGNSGSEKVVVNNTTYTKYYGSGWNIAFNQGNGFEVPAYYGNNYPVTNGMIIVFDFSAYELYY